MTELQRGRENRPNDQAGIGTSNRLLALVLVGFLVLGVVYSVITPIFEASDERWHYPVVKHIADGKGLPVQDPEVPSPWHQEGSQPPLYYLLSAALTSWVDTSDFADVQRPNPHAIVGLPQVVGNKNMMIHTDREAWPWRGTTLAVHLIRLVSVGLGAITVWLTWQIARCLWPGNDQVALLAAMLVAFNSMFLFISASVNNDSLAALLAAGIILVLLRALQRGQTILDGLLLGVLLGLGASTKLSVLALLPLSFVALTYDAWRHRTWGTWLINGILIAGGVLLIAGWWYWRNWAIYGDLTGTSRMLDIAGRRDEPLTLGGLWAEFEGFRISYWALFGGVSILADHWVYPILDVLVLIASIGVVVAGAAIIRQLNRAQTQASSSQRDDAAAKGSSHLNSKSPLPIPYFLLLAWVVLVFVLLIRWTSLTYASQGRLMFVAIAGIATLLAVGLVTLTPKRWRWAMVGVVGIGLLLLAVASPFRYIMPAYARPPLLTEAEVPADLQRVDWDIDGVMRLLGYRLEQLSVHPAEQLAVTVYWQALAPMTDDYSVFVHLLGRDRAVVGQANTYPGLGAWPTTTLEPGDVVADTYYVPIAPTAESPSLLRVYAGLYRYYDAGRPGLPTVDARGEPVEPWLASAKLTPWVWPQVTPSHPLQVQFGDTISLIGYDLDDDLTLYWQAIGQPPDDYSVFIQLWDEDGQLAGFDGPPVRNDYPTSWWEAGETIVDVHPLDLSKAGVSLPLESGRYRLLVGLYRLDTGERMPAVGPDGSLPNNAVDLLVGATDGN